MLANVHCSKILGLFPFRLLQTVFVLQIRKAAHETKDTLFTFGAGQDVRQCAFKFAFLKFMKDLQVSDVKGGYHHPSAWVLEGVGGVG